ncbi:titin [Trichonephila inaurata madagascariensis]|uniref:Titin n=1 Tax=Trichonephila inaurata madagascariensis TaxID=2747483 RepID=A0A8X6IPU0_9ARAC|nr:titin [Trichonephila inaurata madagascariensis]
MQALIGVIVADIPKIRKFSFQDSIVEGDVVSVMCFAMTKVKPITFQWLKNDHEMNEFQDNMRLDTGSEISALIIDPVKLTDSGNYTCVTTNSDGSDRFTATLNVKASPKWIEQPDDITTIMGTSIESRCTASGSPEPQINWKKIQDNKNIQLSYHHQWSPGRNSSMLKISPVTYDHSGLYECIADNGISPSIKSNFTLSVRDPPKVKPFRFEDNIREGDVASVTCLVTSGSKPVKFQWNKNGNPISINNKNVRIDDGAIHSVLVFDSVKLTDDANYSCIAKNTEGQDSFTAELYVKSSPKWKVEPKSVITQVGGSVKVDCLAFGSPRPSIKWRKVIPEGNEFKDVKPPVGNENDFSSGIFHLDSVSESDSGFYECIASNGIEPNIRNNFSIVIRDVPKIQSFSFPENVVERNMVSVTCIATTKTKPISFTWLKDNKEINALEGNIRISTVNEVSVLIIDPVTLENSGNYTCSATNSAGNDKFTSSLKVKASPKWTEQPLDLITTVGATVTVRCLASGSPEPTIQWTKKDGSKTINVNPTVSTDAKDSSLLRLSPVSYEDAGVYECMADNGIPPVITSNFTLTIRDVPEIQKFSFQDDTLEGKIISVTCLAASKSKPVNFNWYKNGKEISSSERNLKIKNDNEFSVLILDPVTLHDNANYTCKATNIHGSDQHTAYLNVKAPPKWLETPKDIITTIGDSVIVTCDASGSPKPRIYWKKLLEPRTQSLYNLNSTYFNSSDSTIKISRVSYGDSGTYECTAENGIQPSIKANFTVTVREPPIIKKFQFEENVKEGDFVSVVCIVRSGTQPITFMWFKDGQEFRSSSKDATIETSPLTSALLLNSVTSESDGNYTCKAKNSYGSDQHSSALKVKASPKWILQPSDVVTVMGEAISIQCIASGSPLPQVIWKKYSVAGAQSPVQLNLNSSHVTSNGSTLKFPRVSYDDSGMYECSADNGISPIIKQNFSITIRGRKYQLIFISILFFDGIVRNVENVLLKIV